MRCDLIRKTKKIYCQKDFIYQVSIQKKSSIRPSNVNNYDATYSIEKEFNLMCYAEIKHTSEIEVDGEPIDGKIILEITTRYFNDFQNIKQNTKLWRLKYKDEYFNIFLAEKINLINNYVMLSGEKVKN